MSRRRARKRKTIALVIVAVMAAGIGVVAYATNLLRRTELQTIDARFSIRGPQEPPDNLVLVEIDGATFQELTRLHKPSEWPFPRRYDAHVIERLRAAGARTIAMDIEFSHPTDYPDDLALFEALGEAHGKTVLAATEVGAHGETGVLGGPEHLAEIGARVADARLSTDSDGSVRRFAFSYTGLRTFPVVTAEVATHRQVKRSLFEDGTLPIDYAGPPGAFKSISFSKVMQGDFPPSLVRGKIVIVGASAPILHDLHTTATSGSAEMPGPEIWANATESLLEGVPLRDAPGWLDVALIMVLGTVVPLGSLRLRPRRSLLSALALAIVFSIAIQVAFNRGLIVVYVYPMLALVLGTLGTLAVLYMIETIERERVRDVFTRFVPAGVVDDVLASADENLRLGAVERDCTVLFSDLRGFTSFSETQPAARVIEVVNFYLNEMTEAILDAGGTLISYMGDGIMAVFGAPLPQEDHADRAVAAAREMIGQRLDRFNEWLAEEGFDRKFVMGVGLNSGTVMAGNVGSEQRVEYTALGDTTNTASRLEGMTKDSEAMLFISASTRERMRGPVDELSHVGEFEIRGRTATLGVWTIWLDGPSRNGPEAQEDGEAAPAKRPGGGEDAVAASVEAPGGAGDGKLPR